MGMKGAGGRCSVGAEWGADERCVRRGAQETQVADLCRRAVAQRERPQVTPLIEKRITFPEGLVGRPGGREPSVPLCAQPGCKLSMEPRGGAVQHRQQHHRSSSAVAALVPLALAAPPARLVTV